MMLPMLQGKPVRDFAQPPGIVFQPHPDPGPYLKVKVALLDPAFKTTANVTPDPTPQLPQYSEATLPPADSGGVLVNLDSQTQKLATEFTPPGRVVQRRVSLQELPGFAPDPNPQPLQEQSRRPRHRQGDGGRQRHHRRHPERAAELNT